MLWTPTGIPSSGNGPHNPKLAPQLSFCHRLNQNVSYFDILSLWMKSTWILLNIGPNKFTRLGRFFVCAECLEQLAFRYQPFYLWLLITNQSKFNCKKSHQDKCSVHLVHAFRATHGPNVPQTTDRKINSIRM